MKGRDSSRIHDRLIHRLEKRERRTAVKRDRFFRMRLAEIHSQLFQALMMKRIIETDDPGAVSDALLKGLKQAIHSNEFDFDYFIAPIRTLVPRANPYSLYITQYIMEVLLNDPHVIEVYGTDLEIYKTVNEVVSKLSVKFERAQEEAVAQLAHSKSLVPGSREYDLALEQLIKNKIGESPQV